MAYTFGNNSKPVSTRNNNRRRRETSSSPSTSTYTFDDSNAMFQTAQEFNDGHSLTYSASSSQAGESTDSSVADIEFLRMVEKEQQMKQAYQKRGVEQQMQQSFVMQSSVADASLGYSTDEHDTDYPYDDQGGRRQLHNQPSGRGSGRNMNWSNRAQNTSGRQPSDSHGHDGGYHNPRGHIVISNKSNKSTPNTRSRKTTSDFSSPTMVSTDISNGSAHTPPPRHVKRISSDEVWYQKWWMCGFTDAFSS